MERYLFFLPRIKKHRDGLFDLILHVYVLLMIFFLSVMLCLLSFNAIKEHVIDTIFNVQN